MLIALLTLGAGTLHNNCDAVEAANSNKTIVWDSGTLVQIHRGGTYPRLIRLMNGDILCTFEDKDKSWVTRSSNNGRSWKEPVLSAENPHGCAANPELLQLRNGWILLLYNDRPTDGIHPFAIQVCVSKDNGRTWQHLSLPYTADIDHRNGCWEPAAVQLDDGEIQLFFANENPYRDSDEQEITLVRSYDNAKTWSKPEKVSFRPGHRDGMPVPLVLRGGRGIVIAIEDNGLGKTVQPAIIHTSLKDLWRHPPVGADDPRRWRALITPIEASEAGAPYIRQMPTGETVLSFQSTEGGRAQPQMVVYLGDENVRNFSGRSVPFTVPPTSGGWWNSLFVKDNSTITAVSSCNGGIWAIDGRIK